ncbi:MAG: type VI secretion system tip protein VgrG [Bacteroidales bacterium]|nr:type VI secretion system tip protein VgrG [Bacteroidales bacterium]
MPEERSIPVSAAHREFTVKVDGVAVERVHQLLSASIVNAANKISSATLIYLDGSPSQGDFPLSNQDLFIPGKRIQVEAGPTDQPQSLFEGIIIKNSIKMRGNSAPQLIVECRHEAVKLSVGRKNGSFFNKTDQEIIIEIISNASLSGSSETTSVQHAQMVQYYCTDWDFILSRCRANGLWLLSNDNQLKAVKPAISGTPAINLLFGATLLEFDIETDARQQISGVQSTVWDASSQSTISQDGSDAGTLAPGNLESQDLSRVVGLENFHTQQTNLPQEEVQAWADSIYQTANLNKVCGRLKCEGIAEVNPGDVISVSGVGERFSGNIIISGIRHSINQQEGWMTHMQFGLPEEGILPDEQVTAPQAGALLPAINGLQIGIVIDNIDPIGENRVRVRMPLLDPAGDGIWARMASLDAGNNRGFFFLPEPNDEVILGFLDDDPRQPVILGKLFSSANPPPFSTASGNPEKGYLSREGIKIYINDEEKILKLEMPSGRKLLMDDSAQKILLEDDSGNKIEMKPDKVSIESAMELEIKAGLGITINGLTLDLSGDNRLKLEATGSVELSSSGNTVIRGAIVQIN